MTYPTNFTPSQKMILTEMINSCLALKPGQTMIVEHPSQNELNQRRYLLYAWLSPLHTNQKELFKISTLSPNSFMVLRRHDGGAKITVSEDEAECFVMDHLIDVVDEELALSIIHEKCKDPVKQSKIYEEWRMKLV